MKLVVCALADLDDQVRLRRPSGVVSLLSHGQTTPSLPWATPRLRLSFNDIAAPREGLVPPDLQMVDRLLGFAGALPPAGTLLFQCWLGISRSPAAAFIIACAQAASTPEWEIARALRRAAPEATPNPLMIRLADDRLARDGRMVEAVSRIGRGREACTGAPFELSAGFTALG